MHDPASIERAREAAFGNVVASLSLPASLPGQVFCGHCAAYFFLQSDYMFLPSFVDAVQELLSAEGATSCCLLNLSRTHVIEYGEAAAIFLEAQTTRAEYYAQLRGGQPGEWWLTNMEHYGCSSDGGSWSIYCERDADMAVFALRTQSGDDRFAAALRQLAAEPIDTLVEKGDAAVLPFSDLLPEWRNGLLKEYGDGRLHDPTHPRGSAS